MNNGLHASQVAALLDCVAHGSLRRTKGGYCATTPGNHAKHSTRAMFALERAEYVKATDFTSEYAPTDKGRAFAANCTRKAA